MSAIIKDTSMKYCNDKDIHKMIKTEVKLGSVFYRGGKHGKLTLPNGGVLIVPSSPSDRKTLSILKAQVQFLKSQGV